LYCKAIEGGFLSEVGFDAEVPRNISFIKFTK